MSLIATLIARPGQLPSSRVTMAARVVKARAEEWLAEETACDLPLTDGADARETEIELRRLLASDPIDIVVQESANRRKKLLIADMDSTMIGQECIDELADAIGIKPEVAAITARAMNGEIAFEPALRERVRLLKGLPVSAIEEVIRERITLAPGSSELVATMKKNGARTALVSGGFTAFTSRIGGMLGFDENSANRLIEEDGRLTGTVAEPILGRQAKADALTSITARFGLSRADAIAVGDGANDLDMIKLAGTGVALHAKPMVAAEAPMRIDHGDLTALLYIQGYRRSEFVT
ncbi:MAG TPA: phosphoserine phosphatase SerB [Rhizobiaceae bacterium]|nr:phosphoserine phosphatase SerB [Rhizobiaceae bacterium]